MKSGLHPVRAASSCLNDVTPLMHVRSHDTTRLCSSTQDIMARPAKRNLPAISLSKKQPTSSKSQSLTKVPVQPVQTGPGSNTLNAQLEKLKKENAILCEWNKGLTERDEDLNLNDKSISKAELRATLIPKPLGECGCSTNSKKKGYHL